LLAAIWVLWLLAAFKHVGELRRWCAALYELTPNELSLPYWPHGKFTCRVCPSSVSRIVVERNVLGQLLDFATFRIEGPQGVHIMRFVPYPEQLILDLENWLPQPTGA
jgi:hypothetical protein